MSSLPHLLIVIGFAAMGLCAAALLVTEVRRDIRSYSRGEEQ